MASSIQAGLKDAFLQNRGMKLLSLALAVLTFYAIRNATNDEEARVVEVKPELEADAEIVEQVPMSVMVTFRGSREDLKKLDPRDLKVELSPKLSDPGSIPIRARDIRPLVPGTRVVGFDPSSVRFTLRRKPRLEKPEAPEPAPKPEPAPAPGEGKPPDVFVTREWTNITVMAVGEPRTLGSVLITPPVVTLVCQGPAQWVNALTSGVPIIFVDCSDMKVSEIVQRPVKVFYPGQTNLMFSVRPPNVEISFWKSEKE